jgi:RsiW-degrading membrane proteinase PrsW (M82 family)
METLSLPMIFLAVLCGVLPPLVWLYFLLHEDRVNPEPQRLIFMAFLVGMLAVPIVVPLETLAASVFPQGLPLITSWAVIEEVAKFAMVALFILWRKEVDEPLDVVIYILTVALGFAALENTLFLLTPLAQGTISEALITDNLRFVGSTLLHVIASSAIAFPLAFAFNLPKAIRVGYAVIGLILAASLHTIFNFFIIDQNGSESMLAFFFVWTGAIIFFALFEILKYEEYRNYPLPPDILRVWQTTSDDLSLSDSRAPFRQVTTTTTSTTISSRSNP